MSKSKKPIPFRSPKQQASIRQGLETRARRSQLLALAKKQPSFERWTAADLQKLFFDVDEWARAISGRHQNAPLVYDLQERIAAEYKRRHQEDPWMVEQRKGVDRVEAWMKAQSDVPTSSPRLTVVRNDEPDPAS